MKWRNQWRSYLLFFAPFLLLLLVWWLFWADLPFYDPETGMEWD